MCVCVFVCVLCVYLYMWPHTLYGVLIDQTQPLGSNLFFLCISVLLFCLWRLYGVRRVGGRKARDKERLMRQWKRRRRRRGRQVQRTPGAITGARQKRRQEIKVVLATWHYRLSAAVSEQTSESRWKCCCVGFQERTSVRRRRRRRRRRGWSWWWRRRSSRWTEEGWATLTSGDCIWLRSVSPTLWSSASDTCCSSSSRFMDAE